LRGNQLFHLIDGEKAAAYMKAAHQRVFTHQFWPKARMFRKEEGEPSDLTSPHYPLPFHGDLLMVTMVGNFVCVVALKSADLRVVLLPAPRCENPE
jgi:hypothetical protein